MRSAIWEGVRVGAEDGAEEEEEGGGGGAEKSRAAMSDSVKEESPHFRMTLEAAGGLVEERLEGESDLGGKTDDTNEGKREAVSFSQSRERTNERTNELEMANENERLVDTHSEPPDGLPGTPAAFFFPPEDPPPALRRALRAETFFAISSADCPPPPPFVGAAHETKR